MPTHNGIQTEFSNIAWEEQWLRFIKQQFNSVDPYLSKPIFLNNVGVLSEAENFGCLFIMLGFIGTKPKCLSFETCPHVISREYIL